MVLLSDTLPIIALKHAPYAISKLDGSNLDDLLAVVAHPKFPNCYNTVLAFTRAGCFRRIGSNFYLSHQTPLSAGVHSLRIQQDCSEGDLINRHLPQAEIEM